MIVEKPQLHISALSMLWKCGEQYRRRYVENEIIPPGVALIVGTATHKSAEMNLKTKCREDKLLSVENVQDIARDELEGKWDRGIKLDEDQAKEGVAKTKGAAIDKATSFAKVHCQELAPVLNPISEDHVERKWVVEISGYPIDLAGTIDVQEKDSVRDLKTSAKSPALAVADKSDQMTAYAMAILANDGAIPSSLALDYIVNLKNGPVVKTVKTTRTKDDLNVLLRRIERSVDIIEKGAFAPTNQDNWWCDTKWCGYATTCPFFRGLKQF